MLKMLQPVLRHRCFRRTIAALLLVAAVSTLLLLRVDLQRPLYALESRKDLKTSEELKILIVVCVSDSKVLLDSSDRQLQQAKVSMKAAVFLSRRRIRFHIVSDSQAVFDELVAATEAWPTAYREKTSFQFVASWYPPEHEDMKGLFRPCSSQRLFLLRLLPEESAVLYMDSDVIFLRPPEELWQIFNEFNEEQFAAAAVYVAGYHYLPKDVRYSDVGFNAGLMLYNLTRMRQFPAGWEDQVLNITAEYHSIFKLGDQDILNIFFGKFRSHFYPLGCEWNLRFFYCQSNFIRHCPEMLKAGAKAVHGTAASFHRPGKFKAFYKSWEALNMTQSFTGFQAELKNNVAAVNRTDTFGCVGRDYIDRILSQQLTYYKNLSTAVSTSMP